MAINKKPSLVSSLSMSFRRAASASDDHDKVKQGHRDHLHELIEDYRNKVSLGEAEGIRNAKDLIEVMKMDLLLLGEATERTETNTLDDAKVFKVSQVIDEHNPAIQQLMDDMLSALNGANDDADDRPIRRPQVEEIEDTEDKEE